MSLPADTTDSTQPRIGSRVLFGKALMLIDTLWGAVAVLGGVLIIGPNDAGGRESLLDLALAISLIVGLPAYVLDSRSRRRIIVFLPALYLFRWYVGSHIRPPPYDLSPPWRGSVLLIVASVLLQWSKLQRSPDSTGRR